MFILNKYEVKAHDEDIIFHGVNSENNAPQKHLISKTVMQKFFDIEEFEARKIPYHMIETVINNLIESDFRET